MDLSFEDYGLRNLQSKILAHFILVAYKHHKTIMKDVIEDITDLISDAENKYQLDGLLRSLICLIEDVEDEVSVKNFHVFVGSIMNALLSAFASTEIDSHGRELILHILFLNLRCVSWADGIDNSLVEECLNETFN